MDKAMTELASSLKSIQDTLNILSTEWNGSKGQKGDVNTVIKGLCEQVKFMGEQMEKLVKSMKTAQGLNCYVGEEAKNSGRQNADYLDDLDQRSLLGKIAISIQDPELKKRIGILDTGDYNAFDVDLLIHEVNNLFLTAI